MSNTDKNTRIQLSLPSELVAALRQAAEKDVRTVTGFLQVLLSEHPKLQPHLTSRDEVIVKPRPSILDSATAVSNPCRVVPVKDIYALRAEVEGAAVELTVKECGPAPEDEDYSEKAQSWRHRKEEIGTTLAKSRLTA